MNWAAELSAFQWGGLVVLSLICGLDRTALAQTLLCRPVVCGSLCGLIMGNYSAGLLMGALMELLWLMRLPVGATVAPDDTQATIAAVFLFCGFSAEHYAPIPESVLIAVVLLFAAVFAYIGRLIDIGARHMNGRIQRLAQSRLVRVSGTDSPCALRWANVAGLSTFALAGLFSQIIILCATLSSIVLITPLLARFPWQVSEVPIFAALLAGVSAVYVSITVRYGVVLFGIGFGVTLFFTLV